MIIFITGKPNCGKDTQAKLLAQKYNLEIVQTGHLLREWAKNGKNDIAAKINETIQKGYLVPVALTTFVWVKRIIELPEGQGVIFEGNPRYLIEAESLVEFFNWLEAKPLIAIYLDMPDEEVYKRSTTRRYCDQCGESLSLALNPGLEKCPNCGGDLIQRNDDNPEVIKTRLEVFYRDIIPAINFLKEKQILYSVNAIGSIEEIHQNITQIIDNILSK